MLETRYTQHFIHWQGKSVRRFLKNCLLILLGKISQQRMFKVFKGRHDMMSHVGNAIFFVLTMLPFLLLLIVMLYFVKQMLGIDIFPNIHLPNYLRDFLGA